MPEVTPTATGAATSTTTTTTTASPDPGSDPDGRTLEAERAHLRASRAALRRMHDDVLATRTALGDAVVDKYANAVVVGSRRDRALALQDPGAVPPFFGRLDLVVPSTAGTTGDAGEVHVVHLGRRNVHDAAGTPMVVDWRTPVAAAFYRAGPEDPMGVRLRRRYGFDRTGELTAYEDERLDRVGWHPDAAGTVLATELDRPRSGPMRDIVSTLQPEQDELVRAPLERSVCVQGAPGTGKTAVGLHRVAYLLYTERDRLRRGGAVVVGPNRSFLAYIRDVLPALGEIGVTQVSVAELLDPDGRGAGRTDDPVADRLKGDARMAEIVRRDLWSRVRPPAETLVVPVGSRRVRLAPDELTAILADVRRRGLPYGTGRGLLPALLASRIVRELETSGASVDDRTESRVRRGPEVKAAIAAMWPVVDPATLVLGLFTDERRLARAAEGLLDPEERAAVLRPDRPRTVRAARWSLADLAVIDEVAGLLGRAPGFAHVVVDEAQDLSPMQCRAVARRVAVSCTVLGDLAQATAPGAAGDWPTLLTHLGAPDARVTELHRGYRVPDAIVAYAARLLPRLAPDLRPPTSARRTRGALRTTTTSPAGLPDAVVAACRAALGGEGAVGLIAADGDVAALHAALAEAGVRASLLRDGADDTLDAERLVCVPATLAKGLEFEHVVVAEPAAIAAAERRGLNRLYVVLTRAVSSLHLVHAAALPAPLTGPPAAGR